MSKLKAKDPTTAEQTKPKVVLFGQPKIGKTWFTLGWPDVYFIAAENGASQPQYTKRLKDSGGVYFGREDGAADFDAVIEEIKTLATVKHSYKTLVIDSITELWIVCVQAELDRMEKAGEKIAFGNERKLATRQMKRLVAAIQRLDMSCVLIAHEKSMWGKDASGNQVELGKTPDINDKTIYDLDLIIQAQKRGASRVGVIKGSRLIGFPDGESFPLDYESFAERYGKGVIEKASTAIKLATPEQVAEINRLVDLLKIESATVEKWLEKANAETVAEFNETQANKIIESLKSKIK